jgi:crotonobetainyl-CoA:carnitine CoA-transferase CaiB-like acyl-CoA transferase
MSTPLGDASGVPTPSPRKPLSGLRVIDAATFLAAPFSATLLGEFGAEVIKVEQPGAGDPLRRFGTVTEAGHSLNWANESRNKKPVTLDLRTPEGADILKQLVSVSDVLMENFRPGTFEKWGLGYDVLKEINPRLVMLRLSAFGQTGPYKDLPGFARIAHAFSGLSLACGEPGRVPVTPGASTLADYASGVWGAFATMVALADRASSGHGQCIDLALYQATFRYMDEMVPAYAKTGQIRERMGAETHNLIPHGHFRSSDDRWLAMTCSSDKMFERLVTMIDSDVLRDPKFARVTGRIPARAAINGIVIDWFAARTASQIQAECDRFDVPCSLLYSVADIFEDAHYKARGDLLVVDDPINGRTVVPAPFPRMSETPGTVEHLGLPLGACNREIFEGLLKLDPARIEALKQKGII